MIRRIDHRAASATGGQPTDYRRVVPRGAVDVDGTIEVVRPIVEAVRHRGVEAIAEYSEKFDGVQQTDITVPAEAIKQALANLDPAVRAALEESVRRLRATCEAELEQDVTVEVAPGGRVTQRLVPVQRVGLYVPGGVAPLVS